ncbi:MAG: glycosyltransferase family 39 protein [Eubacteriales bacterium]
MAIVAAVFSVLAGLQFDTVPRYDGGLYYDALITATDTFTYSLNSFVSAFTFFTHPLQGTSLLISIGEMLFPRQSVGVYIVTLIVTDIAIFCLYGIMGRIFPDKAPWLKAAGTAVFAFCPYVLGLFSHINPDYFISMFFVILIYAFAEELDYLAAFMFFLIIFSKETGILFAASFLLSAILIRAGKAEGKNYFAKIKQYLFPRRILLYSVAPLLLLSYYYLFSQDLTFGATYTNQSPIRWDNDSLFCFGINTGYISSRIAQIMYFNFFWIITILIVTTGIVYFFRKNRKKAMELIDPSADFSILIGITLSSFIFMLFSCFFITTMCPRYNVCFALPISLISVGAISYIWKRQIQVKIVTGSLILLFILQNYFNLDPTLSLGNEKINLGFEYIYSPTGEYSFMNLDYINEMYVYNRTFDYAEDLLDKLMEKINPDISDHFLMVGNDWYAIYLTGNRVQTDHLIFWDPVHQKRTYNNKGEGVFLPDLSTVSSSDILSCKEIELKDDFYFILPANLAADIYSAALEARGYSITDSFVVKNYLGYLTVYHMALNG